MKRRISLFMLLALMTSAASAQGWKDKLTGGGGDAYADKEWESLSDIAGRWSDGSYSARRESGGMWEPQGKKEVKFNKDETGVVTTIEASGVTYTKTSKRGAKFTKVYSKGNDVLYLTDVTIVQYRLANGTQMMIERLWGEKMGIGKCKKEITAFREYAASIMEGEQGETDKLAEEERKKEEAARLEKFGLGGKQIGSIEIINLVVPEKFGHFRGFSFDMEATLKDGGKISTAGFGEGYISDYKITYSDGYDGMQVEQGLIDSDKIIVTVALASDASVKATKDVVLLYNEDVFFSYNGLTYSRSAGTSADNYKIEIKQTKHAINGSKLLMIRVTNVSTSQNLSEFKMGIDQTLKFNCSGGSGGVEDGRGNNGANGGNITVIKDPNVEFYNISYKNNAGRGGKGISGNPDGRDGRDGTFKEETRAVSF